MIFGLFDYALLIGIIVGLVYYVRLPYQRKKDLKRRIERFLEMITQSLGFK